MVPNFFEKSGKVSTVSGVLNSCTYIGSALSTYGIALLSKQIGWQHTVLVWFAIAFVGSLCCLFCAKPWQKKMMS
jgi:OPA family glycerol-3-phosphate transporter-like MFS transporter